MSTDFIFPPMPAMVPGDDPEIILMAWQAWLKPNVPERLRHWFQQVQKLDNPAPLRERLAASFKVWAEAEELCRGNVTEADTKLAWMQAAIDAACGTAVSQSAQRWLAWLEDTPPRTVRVPFVLVSEEDGEGNRAGQVCEFVFELYPGRESAGGLIQHPVDVLSRPQPSDDFRQALTNAWTAGQRLAGWRVPPLVLWSIKVDVDWFRSPIHLSFEHAPWSLGATVKCQVPIGPSAGGAALRGLYSLLAEEENAEAAASIYIVAAVTEDHLDEVLAVNAKVSAIKKSRTPFLRRPQIIQPLPPNSQRKRYYRNGFIHDFVVTPEDICKIKPGPIRRRILAGGLVLAAAVVIGLYLTRWSYAPVWTWLYRADTVLHWAAEYVGKNSEPPNYPEALRRYRVAAAKGSLHAEYLIGASYEKGQGVPQDYAAAAEWYRRAAEKGGAEAQFALGYLYHEGRGVSRDYSRALRWYRRAADQGYALAQCHLGGMYEKGEGVLRSYDEAARWYLKAAARSLPRGLADLANMYYLGRGGLSDKIRARELYQQAAAQDDPTGECGLGLVAMDNRDYPGAFQWFTKAAGQGNAYANLDLGILFESGKYGPVDYEQARIHYERAAAAGNSDAVDRLGLLYQWGRGVSPDLDRAVTYYRGAADQGSPWAQYHLGMLYDSGKDDVETPDTAPAKGVAKDNVKAVQYYRAAADQGLALAQVALAEMYANGRGHLPQDRVQQLLWLDKAVAQKEPSALRRRGVIHAAGEDGPADRQKAIDYLLQAVQAGDGYAQCDLGHIYLEGWGVEKNMLAAYDWFRKSADQGNDAGETGLGVMYRDGLGIPRDEGKAFDYFTQAAKQGYTEAEVDLGLLYREGQGVPKDLRMAFNQFKAASDQGDPDGDFYLGVMYERGWGIAQDYQQARISFENAANKKKGGHAGAECHLGILYQMSWCPDDKDYTNALKWLRLGVSHGGHDSECRLGVASAMGLGVPQDVTEAFRWFEKSAEGGDADGAYMLGVCYSQGTGHAQDYDAAFKWSKKAADAGKAGACYNVAVAYSHGWGCEQNEAQEVAYYRKAADLGDPDGERELGKCFATGRVVKKDLATAQTWLEEAVAQGDEAAKAELQHLLPPRRP